MTLNDFKPKFKYLICIDSDGCAVDSMTIKHKDCFGKAFLETFDLTNSNEAMDEWLRINLYSKTRGINRFLGLELALKYVDKNIKKIDDLSDLTNFINTSKTYSNKSLEEYIKNNDSAFLKKCLAWSNLTNTYINLLPKENVRLFKYVKERIEEMYLKADICVVSSANEEAVLNEWNRLGLSQYISVFCTQNNGTKEKCLEILSKHYYKENVLMIGDGPGDLEAAKNNHIYFYPILANYENKSWKDLNSYLDLFFTNEFKYCHYKLIDKFEENLK